METGPIKARRKSFDIEYMQVTPLNIEEVAKWCDGIIKEDGDKEGQLSRKYIKVSVVHPISLKQTEAHVGDFVVKQKRTFKVYEDRPFYGTFEMPDGRPIGGDPRPYQGKNKNKKNKPQGQNRPQQSHQQPNTRPNPSQMPKKVAAPVSTDVLDGNAKVVADAASIKEREATPDEIKAYHEEVQKLREEAEATPVAEVDVSGTIRNKDGEVIYDPSLDATPVEDLHSSPEPVEEKPFFDQLHEVEEILEEVNQQDPGAFEEAEEESEAPKPMTLDELNELPGDPRSLQEIQLNDRLAVENEAARQADAAIASDKGDDE